MKKDVYFIYQEKFGDDDIKDIFNQDYFDPMYIRFILKYCVLKNKKYSKLSEKERNNLETEYYFKRNKLTLKDFLMEVKEWVIKNYAY